MLRDFTETEGPTGRKTLSLDGRAEQRNWTTPAKVLERSAHLCFATAIFLVPLVFDTRTIDAFNLTKLTTLWFFGLLALGCALLSAAVGGGGLSMPGSRILWLALTVLGVTVLATLVSPNPILSIFGLYHRYEGLVSIALYVGALVLMVVLYHRRPDRLGQVATAIAAAGVIAAAHVISQRFGYDVTQWRQSSGAPPRFPIGPLGNSAFTAAYLGIAAPFVLYRAVGTRLILRRGLWAVALVITMIGLWIAGGRAGMLGAAAGLVAVPLFASRILPSVKLSFVAIAVAAVVLTPIAFGDPSDPAETELLRTGTAGYRVQIWEGSLQMFADRPVLGWGPETFYGYYPSYRTAEEARRTGFAITDKPHSVYLGWATSTGAVGFAVYLLLFCMALILVAERASRLERSQHLLAAGFGAGLVSYLVQGVFSIDVPPLLLMAWVCLGAIAVLFGRREDSDRQDPAAHARPRWPVAVIVVVVVVALIVAGFGPLRADHAAWAAQRRASGGWSSETMELYEKAIALNPYEAAYRGLAGDFLLRMADDRGAPFPPESALGRSASRFLEALELQPRNVFFMLAIARVYARLGSVSDVKYFRQGDRWMSRGVELDPLNPKMRDAYVAFLRQWQAEADRTTRRELRDRALEQSAISRKLLVGRAVR